MSILASLASVVRNEAGCAIVKIDMEESDSLSSNLAFLRSNWNQNEEAISTHLLFLLLTLPLLDLLLVLVSLLLLERDQILFM